MSVNKPSIPKGTRDFGPPEMIRRNFIFSIVREVFKKYGYLPIETPAMEKLDSLLGKYGEEGDKLLFRILNSGDFLSRLEPGDLHDAQSISFSNQITEKGLRYDLTVPFARFVVQHRNEISFPFKRFQIQPVWRADRPQKGRYREFFQCDVDVIGSKSLLSEVELLQIIDEVFGRLGIRIAIKLNNRKVLAGIAEAIGQKERMVDLTVAIDKIDKIGLDNVINELLEKDFTEESIRQLKPVLEFSGEMKDKLEMLTEMLGSSQTGLAGIVELTRIFNYLERVHIQSNIELDLSLARGLNYYTGAIIEVIAMDTRMGSVCGGGRYDDLTGIFGLKDVSGVGVSFGADRIYDVMSQENLFPVDLTQTTRVMFVNFGEEEEKYCLQLLEKIRKAGISAELYPESTKMKKQMAYANEKKVEFVALVGPDEILRNQVALKNMETGDQQDLSPDELIVFLKGNQ